MKIPIPEKIWICSNMGKSFSWEDLNCKPEECKCYHRGLCETEGFLWCRRYGLCDAQAYIPNKEEINP
jgi:hypothetical protein